MFKIIRSFIQAVKTNPVSNSSISSSYFPLNGFVDVLHFVLVQTLID